MSNERETYAGWTILELMGHRRLGGYVTEQEIAGAGFLRIDIPGADGTPAATQFIPPSSVYCITPTTEPIARAVALRNQPAPVARWELPALPEKTHLEPEDDPYEPDEPDDDDRDDIPL
jgi:hypothetical protein